jgi:outer membrane protein assembly factor BamB
LISEEGEVYEAGPNGATDPSAWQFRRVLGSGSVLHADSRNVLAAGADGKELLCLDAAKGQTVWKAAAASRAMWACRLANDNFLVLTSTGVLLTVDLARGGVTPAGSVGGVPTGPPAVVKGELWVPVNGYRIVKVAMPAGPEAAK